MDRAKQFKGLQNAMAVFFR